jgi:hypothetical protein
LRRFGADAAVIYRGAAASANDDLTYTGESARVSSDKVARELGLMPAGSLAETMAWTLDWARYARVLPS